MDAWRAQLDIPYRLYRKRRAMVLNASTRCHICNEDGATEVDHVIPLHRGGTSSLSNLKPAHGRCNRAKADRERDTRPTVSPTKLQPSDGPTDVPRRRPR